MDEVHESFFCYRELSRWQVFLHGLCIICILYLAYQITSWFYCTSVGVILLMSSYYFFAKQKKLQSFAVFDQAEWTFVYKDHQIERLKVTQIIDHRIYFVFYFESGLLPRSQVIWKDQLSIDDYRKIKIYAELY